MSKPHNKPWWSPIAHFAAHSAVGFIIFLIILVPSVVLSFLVHYLESQGVPGFTIMVLSFLENAIMVADATLFLIYMALGLYRTAKEFSA